MLEQTRRTDGGSFHDQPVHGWPRRRVIWSCDASKGPLLTRYFLIQTRWFALYLHHLHASDEDRALHDHPWSFVTFLLSGGYFEHTPMPEHDQQVCGCRDASWCPFNPAASKVTPHTVRTWRRRFSLLWRPAEWQHRLELVKPTWTLVLRLRRRRQWGFITRSGWQDWISYGKEWCD